MHADIPLDITINPARDPESSVVGGKRSSSVLESRHLGKLRQGGVGGFNAIIWVESEYKPQLALSRGLHMADSLLEDLKITNQFKLARTSNQLEEIFESEDSIALVLGTEGAELIENDLALLRIFYELGVRSFGFVWNERNLLADGYGEVKRRNGGSGLSEFGVRVVEECNRLGMLLDGAHITPNGLADMLEYSSDPIIVSHGSTGVHPRTLRPLSDDHLRAISHNGGVAGMFAINIDKSMPDLVSYTDHVEHAIKIAGIDHVGLGFDFVDYLPKDTLPTSENPSVAGLEDHRCCQKVIEALKSRGYSGADIEKVASKNFLRVFRDVCG
jgi:membrane dipeptidase